MTARLAYIVFVLAYLSAACVAASPTPRCATCEETETLPTDDDLQRLEKQRLKIEMGKILRVLELEDRPSPIVGASRIELPEHLIQSEPEHDDVHRGRVSDVGRKEEFIVASVLQQTACPTTIPANNVCLKLRFESEIATTTSLAYLWLRLQSTPSTVTHHTFTITEIAETGDRLPSITATTITVRPSQPAPNDHWLTIDVTSLARAWLTSSSIDKFLLIEPQSSADALSTQQPPLLEIKSSLSPGNDPAGGRSRKRRSHNNCIPGLYNHCCLKEWTVNFTEIGWDDWIIMPRGYKANYCTGNCRHQQIRAYNAVLARQAAAKELNNEDVPRELIPCCSATERAPLTILYALQPGRIQEAVLPDMILKDCGC